LNQQPTINHLFTQPPVNTWNTALNGTTYHNYNRLFPK
jgi:hypothetical protein